jgi:hypothetical protein
MFPHDTSTRPPRQRGRVLAAVPTVTSRRGTRGPARPACSSLRRRYRDRDRLSLSSTAWPEAALSVGAGSNARPDAETAALLSWNLHAGRPHRSTMRAPRFVAPTVP